jgi:crotonobetainyl-CoA:carnitine CoA-transferase CaiB-like acyl-CoA transferase
MLVETARTDGVDRAVIVPGNPVKLSKMTEGPETRVPWVGEHTDEVLRHELGLGDGELEALASGGVIAGHSPAPEPPL